MCCWQWSSSCSSEASSDWTLSSPSSSICSVGSPTYVAISTMDASYYCRHRRFPRANSMASCAASPPWTRACSCSTDRKSYYFVNMPTVGCSGSKKLSYRRQVAFTERPRPRPCSPIPNYSCSDGSTVACSSNFARARCFACC